MPASIAAAIFRQIATTVGASCPVPPTIQTKLPPVQARSVSPSPACLAGSHACEDALHDDPKLGADALPNRLVDRHVLPDGLDHLPRDLDQGRLAEHLDRAVVDLQRVVECQFVLVQLQRLFVSAAVCETRTAGAAPAHQPSQAALNLSNGLPFSPRCDSQSRAPLHSLEIGRQPGTEELCQYPGPPLLRLKLELHEIFGGVSV